MLVGKLLTNKAFNFNAFRKTMTNVWALNGRIVIRAIDTNRFVFQEISGNEQPDDVPLQESPFWVRIYNLPFNCRSNTEIKAILSMLGEVVEIEGDDLRLEKYRRARVVMDVMKPLRRVQRIRNKEGKVVTVNYKYERPPFFCFRCGKMGHGERDCPTADDDNNGGDLVWGLWLKASPHKGRRVDGDEIVAMANAKKNLYLTGHIPRKTNGRR
ncbi:hypothetical protein RDABS01_016157 [Bienertia sinuspersici]